MPVPYPPPIVEVYTQTPSHKHPCSAVGAQIISLRLNDLVVPKLPACGCEWWRRLVSPSTGGDWWATCHDESCARYSRLQCASECHLCCPSPLHTEELSSLDGSRGLCASRLFPFNWKKKSGVSISLPVPLDKGDRVKKGVGWGLFVSMGIVCAVSFLFSLVWKIQDNHWTKCMLNTGLTKQDQATVPDHRQRCNPLFRADPRRVPRQVGKTVHNVGGLACILRLTITHNQSP